jgi:four helix bundle protein
MRVKSFTELRVWREAHDLALRIYRLTDGFPAHEKYSITSQIRRSASSVSANIAEGFGRGTIRELNQFLIIARGSLKETINYLILAKDLGYLEETNATREIARYEGLGCGINAFLTKLSSKRGGPRWARLSVSPSLCLSTHALSTYSPDSVFTTIDSPCSTNSGT